MIQHVWERTRCCPDLDEVYIATCDDEIRDASEAFGAHVIMTSSTHERASDRIAEAAETLPDVDIVVMVQGDEPLIRPEMISEALAPFSDPAVQCVNLLGAIETPDLRDVNTIKVVIGDRSQALYMSRQPIPTSKDGVVPEGVGKQVCVIPFRADALRLFASLPEGRLECAESIDMLRFLEHGVEVLMVPTAVDVQAVDTPEDLERVRALMTSGA